MSSNSYLPKTEIYIALEILALIADFLGAESLYCFYLASLDFPKGKHTQTNLANLIVSRCTYQKTYRPFSFDSFRHYREVLERFCFPLGMTYLPVENIQSPTEYKKQVEQNMLPIYLRTIDPKSDISTAVLTGSLKKIQKALRDPDCFGFPEWAYRNAFFLGNREVLDFMLDRSQAPKSCGWSCIISSAVSIGPVLENFNLVMEASKKTGKYIDNRSWENILQVCCERNSGTEIVKLILSEYYTGTLSDNMRIRLLTRVARTGNLELFKFLESSTLELSVLDSAQIIRKAIEGGHLHIVQHMEENLRGKRIYRSVFKFEEFTKFAVVTGQLAIVKYFQEKAKVVKGTMTELMTTFGITEALDHNHVKCARYILEQSPDSGKTEGLGEKLFLLRTIHNMSFKRVNLETIKFLYEKFGTVIEPHSLLENVMDSGNREVYNFCREQTSLDILSREDHLLRIFTAIIREDNVEMFTYVKVDLSQRIPNFQEIWAKLEPQLLTKVFSEHKVVRLIKYYLNEVITTQADRNAYFLRVLSSDVMPEDDSFLEILCGYIPNIRVLMENPKANPEIKEHIQLYLL